MLYGRGAGDLPTGSAIVSDIVFAAKQNKHQYTAFKNSNTVKSSDFSKNFRCKYYIRMNVKDEAGVLAKISTAFAKNNVSINTMEQLANDNSADIIFMIHETCENNINKALATLNNLDCVNAINAVIRVE